MNSRLPIARACVKAGLRLSRLPSPVSVTTARSGARAELAARPRITKRNAARQQDLFVIWNLWWKAPRGGVAAREEKHGEGQQQLRGDCRGGDEQSGGDDLLGRGHREPCDGRRRDLRETDAGDVRGQEPGEDDRLAERHYVDYRFTCDGRIADSYYFASALKCLKYFMKNPAHLELPPETIEDDIN